MDKKLGVDFVQRQAPTVSNISSAKTFCRWKTKTGVISDPLGQIHSHTSSEHYFDLKIYMGFARFLERRV